MNANELASYIELRDAAFDIVRRLANESPDADADGWHWCVLCDASLPLNPIDHEPDCPWRMAVEWVEQTAPHPPPP